MAYAQLADVKGRAGALADAWSQDSRPGDGDLERYLDAAAAELDAYIGSAGFGTPVTDLVAVAALRAVNADKALLVAIDATWPGDPAVQQLRAAVAARVQAYDNEMASGSLPALLYLAASSADENIEGGDDFWSREGLQDYIDSLYGSLYASTSGSGRGWLMDSFGIPRTQQPEFRRGMRL